MATINDIAAKVGVSKATVSNVFNNKKNVSKELREKILKVSAELNYHPKKVAQALAGKKTYIVGLFLEKIIPFRKIHHELIEGVAVELNKYGYTTLLYLGYDENMHGKFISGSEPLDGAIILTPSVEDMRIEDLLKSDIPVVLIGQPMIKQNHLPYVDVNNINIVYEVTKLLIEYGHEKIVFINSAPNLTITFDRLAGYIKALKEFKLPFEPSYVFNCDNTSEMGKRIINNILSVQKDFTAIITESDVVAKGVYEGIKEKNLKIPEDVSIFALGGEDEELTPPVSTVSINYKVLGMETVSILNKLMNKSKKNNKFINSTTFDIHRIKITNSIKKIK